MSIEHIAHHKTPEQLLGEVRSKIEECEKFRIALVRHFAEVVQARGESVYTNELRNFIIEFEIRGIDPTRGFIESARHNPTQAKEAGEYIRILNTWLTEIHSRYKFQWDLPSGQILELPRSDHA